MTDFADNSQTESVGCRYRVGPEHDPEYDDEDYLLELLEGLVQEAEDLELPEAFQTKLQMAYSGFASSLVQALHGLPARRMLREARRIAAGPGASRTKIAAILEAIEAPSPAATRNRQLLEWWGRLLTWDEPVLQGVLPDPLEIAPKEHAVPPDEAWYGCQEIHLSETATPLEQFHELARVLGLDSLALRQRLEREALVAARDGDPLGSIKIPTEADLLR